MKFSIRLKEMREAKGLSQAQLAQEIGVGVSTVGMWESTNRVPNAKTLGKLLSFFNCPIDYLLGRTDEFGSASPVSQTLSDDELELLRLYKDLPAEFRRALLNSARLWAGVPADSSAKKKA